MNEFDDSAFSEDALKRFKQYGIDAYHAGVNMGDNPYPVFTAPYKHWENGWWETFYAKTKFYVEEISGVTPKDKIEGSFTETSKYGDAKVYDFAFEKRKRKTK